jgi:Undecaprenyl-phosphate glucose phosphotransferase
MTSAAARRLLPETAQLPEEPSAGPAELTALGRLMRVAETFGEGAAAPIERRQGERRGPLRPERLSSARARMDGRTCERTFRFADAGMVCLLAMVVGPLSLPGGVLKAQVGAVLPYLLDAALLLWALKAFGAYRFETREGLGGHLLRTTLAFLAPAGATTLVLGHAPFSAGIVQLGLWLGISFSAVYLAHLGWWRLVARWRADGRLTRNIVIVGATRNAERLIQALLKSREANVLGVFDDRLARAPREVKGVPVLGDTQSLTSHRLIPYVDRIVVTVPSSAQGRVRQIIEGLRVVPNPVCLLLEFEAERAAGAIERLAKTPLEPLAGQPQEERRAYWKRVQDILIGAMALAVATPLMLGMALWIRLDSSGPILFRQRRHGFNNEEIVVWKFRTMRHEPDESGVVRQVRADDERVTRVGRILRKCSLDELPQLINVLKGEMSLVGPRPHAIGMKTGAVESARLVAEYAHRHRIKPGLTGWAAINGSRGPVDTPEAVRRRVELDVEYIERQSFWLDLWILAMTLPCLLGDRAAVR